ncbi:F-box/LRR-repeat protein At4g14103-like [Lolium perenne]|uniref:F-box/LRR-repeat protein At4g14103-like n=1 Tax=Lolium perenne TaxID=4522 RepID=UPI0021EA0BA2|nr:F-box/LRR-repeat protein At4g14103-like [Lolium perenne]
MAFSPEHKRSAPSDRISGLSDDVLGHVLSFLPTKEAACAAALSRRWRHIFGSVHTISFQEAEGARANDWTTWYYEMLERKSCSDELLDNVSAALLCRRRCARIPVPLRSLRFAFDSWHRWDKVAIDQWLAYVLQPPRGCCHNHPGLHLDLRFHVSPICDFSDDRRRDDDAGSDSDDDPFVNRWRYLLPGRLFSCTALRTLCVAFCRLALPRINVVDLPFLDTMRLTALSDSGRSIQWLISSCPRLADLTLEALWNLKRVSVLNKPLRRFAIRCCHNVRTVDIDASKLRSLEYGGRGLPKSFMSLHGSPPATIPLCTTIGFCKPLSWEAEFANLTRFLEEISNTKHLHLHHGGLQSRFFDAGFPLFSRLTRLTLQGCIGSSNTVATIGRILDQTPNLEILSLLMWESQKGMADTRVAVFDEITEPIFSLPCLRTGVTEISVEDYEGSMPEKMLVKLLLRNALVLERLQVVFTEGLSSEQKNILEVQMGRWGMPNSEKVFM